MKPATCSGLLIIVLFFAAPRVSGQSPRQPRNGADTWYEFLLKQFNPHNFDYGAWLEKRREALLEATAKEPYFWYTASVTAGMLLMLGAQAKCARDHRPRSRGTPTMKTSPSSQSVLSPRAATATEQGTK